MEAVISHVERGVSSRGSDADRNGTFGLANEPLELMLALDHDVVQRLGLGRQWSLEELLVHLAGQTSTLALDVLEQFAGRILEGDMSLPSLIAWCLASEDVVTPHADVEHRDGAHHVLAVDVDIAVRHGLLRLDEAVFGIEEHWPLLVRVAECD